MDKLEKWTRVRIRFVGFLFVLAFVLVVARAFQLQVLGQETWQRRAERQHQKVIPLTAQRGTIYDRNGEEMALSIEVDSIFVDPQKVTDPEAGARALSAALQIPYGTLKAKLSSDKSFIWIKRQISPRESEQVRNLNLPGVNFIKEHQRFYPNSEIGAQVLGFTGIDPTGLEGVELKYNAQLLGQGGYLVMERDALGRGIGAGSRAVEGASRGNDVYLTLDKNIQFLAEKELAEGIKKARAKAGTVIVMDARNGQVLAMASQPDFNPNAAGSFKPSQWRNRALCDTYEPGSTLKTFVMAAALNEGIVKPTDRIFCENGKFRIGGRTIHDHKPHGSLTAAEVVKVSSNIGTAKLGKLLERERLYRYLTDFGFGTPTGIDLPGEVGGLLRKPNQWFEIDLATISFGHGISVTPLQLATATVALANGGYLMSAPLVSKVVDREGNVLEKHEPKVVRQVVSPLSAQQVQDMMSLVSEEGGTGTLSSVPGFKVAGKTGTAQKVDPVTGGYSADKRVSSFVGFVPAKDPRLVILAVVDEPEGVTYGGLVAAPIFSRIADQALRYLKVSPTHPVEASALPALTDMPQDPPPAIGPVDEEPLTTETGEVIATMPDCLGMSYRQVIEAMGRTGLNIKLNGRGKVVEQSPAAGQAITFGHEVWVRLAPPS